MSLVRERYGETFWRKHHEAWQQSTLNQRVYCEAHGIALKAFGNWRAKFKAEPQLSASKLLYRRRGLSHTLSHRLSHSLSHIWSIGPSGYLPFLDFGRLDALIDAQELRTDELLLKYKKTILVAVAEVDDAIKGSRAARQTLRDVETALAESRHALDLATGRYERGLTEFLNVVDAERQLYVKEDERIVAQEAVALQFVLLYKALGGGWERYDLLPPIRQPEPAIVAMFRRLSNQWQ